MRNKARPDDKYKQKESVNAFELRWKVLKTKPYFSS